MNHKKTLCMSEIYEFHNTLAILFCTHVDRYKIDKKKKKRKENPRTGSVCVLLSLLSMAPLRLFKL